MQKKRIKSEIFYAKKKKNVSQSILKKWKAFIRFEWFMQCFAQKLEEKKKKKRKNTGY